MQSTYDTYVPVINRILSTLENLVQIAIDHCDQNDIDESAITGFRLAPDMYDFSKQIHICCGLALIGASRLSGNSLPEEQDDSRKPLPELKALLEKTRSQLNEITPKDFSGFDDTPVEFEVTGFRLKFPNGVGYLQDWIYPNLYFHYTTAYNMLRHNGIKVGKQDYIGAINAELTPI